jgi:hypothetical protein
MTKTLYGTGTDIDPGRPDAVSAAIERHAELQLTLYVLAGRSKESM